MPREIPVVPVEYIDSIFALSERDRASKLELAVEHLRSHNNIIYHAIDQTSRGVAGVVDAALYRTIAVGVYMVLLDHLNPMPVVQNKVYRKFERKMLRPSSDILLQRISEEFHRENPYLYKMVVQSASKAQSDPAGHAIGAMAVYHLLRESYVGGLRGRLN